MLTAILSRAVPEVWVESAAVSHLYYFFIYVEPDHAEYWARFKRRYPWCEQVALKYKVRSTEVACPMFDSIENLINWLIDVLDLTQGESRLLRLSMRLALRCI